MPGQVVGCSSVVVTDYGDETPGLAVLQEYLKNVRTAPCPRLQHAEAVPIFCVLCACPRSLTIASAVPDRFTASDRLAWV